MNTARPAGTAHPPAATTGRPRPATITGRPGIHRATPRSRPAVSAGYRGTGNPAMAETLPAASGDVKPDRLTRTVPSTATGAGPPGHGKPILRLAPTL